MKAVAIVSVFALLATTAGCDSAQPSAAAQTEDNSGVAMSPPSCPLGVVGARVAMEDTQAGVDLTLTAPAPLVEELRTRARDAAQLYGPAAHKGQGHYGKHMGAQRHGLRLTELPPVAATVENVDQGAKLHLTAKVAPEEVRDLQQRVHARVEKVQSSPCD